MSASAAAMARYLPSIIALAAHTYWNIFFYALVCCLLELAWPKGGCPLRVQLRSALLWLVNGFFFFLFSAVLSFFIVKLHVRPLFLLELDVFGHSANRLLQIGTWVLAPVIALVLGDFLEYWCHRAHHAVPVLWRVHKVHHSIRELSALNSAPHFGETVLRAFFISLPLALLIHPQVGFVPLIVLGALKLQVSFNHSSTEANLGWLRYVISDNRFHRIHHSLEQRHFGTNFGGFSTLWDQVFGTAYFPGKKEWPLVGLQDVAPPSTLREYVMMPMQPISPVVAAGSTVMATGEQRGVFPVGCGQR